MSLGNSSLPAGCPLFVYGVVPTRFPLTWLIYFEFFLVAFLLLFLFLEFLPYFIWRVSSSGLQTNSSSNSLTHTQSQQLKCEVKKTKQNNLINYFSNAIWICCNQFSKLYFIYMEEGWQRDRKMGVRGMVLIGAKNYFFSDPKGKTSQNKYRHLRRPVFYRKAHLIPPIYIFRQLTPPPPQVQNIFTINFMILSMVIIFSKSIVSYISFQNCHIIQKKNGNK